VESALARHGASHRLDGRSAHRDGVHTAVSLTSKEKAREEDDVRRAVPQPDRARSAGRGGQEDRAHLADGKAATDQGKKLGIPDYSSAEFQKSKTDDQLKSAISNGIKNDKGGEMEGYKDKLSGEEIDNLVKLVRSFGK
jgi:hypothetical protein